MGTSFFYFLFANGGFPTFCAGLIPPGPERSRVKPMWYPSGSASGLNLRFLKMVELGADTKTSTSGKGRNRGSDHSANPLGLNGDFIFITK